jgi:hypothetical protein
MAIGTIALVVLDLVIDMEFSVDLFAGRFRAHSISQCAAEAMRNGRACFHLFAHKARDLAIIGVRTDGSVVRGLGTIKMGPGVPGGVRVTDVVWDE